MLLQIVKFKVSEIPFHALWGKILPNSDDGEKTTYIRIANIYLFAQTGPIMLYRFLCSYSTTCFECICAQQIIFEYLPYKNTLHYIQRQRLEK
jgi:hypothetical protein